MSDPVLYFVMHHYFIVMFSFASVFAVVVGLLMLTFGESGKDYIEGLFLFGFGLLLEADVVWRILNL